MRGPYERRHHASTMYDADFCSSLGYIMTLDGNPVNTMNGFVRPHDEHTSGQLRYELGSLRDA